MQDDANIQQFTFSTNNCHRTILQQDKAWEKVICKCVCNTGSGEICMIYVLVCALEIGIFPHFILLFIPNFITQYQDSRSFSLDNYRPLYVQTWTCFLQKTERFNLQCNPFLIKKNHLKCIFVFHYKDIANVLITVKNHTSFVYNSNNIPVVNPINDETNFNPP